MLLFIRWWIAFITAVPMRLCFEFIRSIRDMKDETIRRVNLIIRKILPFACSTRVKRLVSET